MEVISIEPKVTKSLDDFKRVCYSEKLQAPFMTNRNFATDSLKLGPKQKCKELLRKHEVTVHPRLSFYKFSSVCRKFCLPFLMMAITNVSFASEAKQKLKMH